jgi:type IV pilus assembly protein PilN
MRITLNFATRPYADLGPAIKGLRITMAVLAVVAIGLGLFLHALHSKAEATRARNHSLDNQIARIVEERQGYQLMMLQPDNAQVLAKVQALNRLFDEKAFSWTLAMEDLEIVLPPRVQVSNLEPARTKDGHITLHMRVIGPRDRGLELVSNLEHSKRFFLPSIVGENTESVGGPNEVLEPVSMSNRVNFELLAEYSPATLEERKALTIPSAKPDETSNLHAQSFETPKARKPALHPVTKASAQSATLRRAVEPVPVDMKDRTPRSSPRPARPYPGRPVANPSGTRPTVASGGQQ